jgi:hypothetical protein
VHCSVTEIKRKPVHVDAILTDEKRRLYNDERGALRQAVDLSIEQLLVIYLNNRHLAEWRLLLFTQIVMVIPNT